MKIALVAPVVDQVPPRKYGGIELVVFNLAEELVQLGHEVTLFASGDSQFSGTLVATFEKALREYPESADPLWQKEMKEIAIAETLKHLLDHQFDLVHSHMDWKLLPFEECIPCPVVTTFHGFPTVPAHQAVYNRYPESRLISISNAQRRALPHLNYITTIYNGLALERFPFSATTENYLAFLGRMSPEKGPLQAIEVAKKTGQRLIMAAKVDSVDVPFYEQEVKPLIDGDQIQFIGEVDHEGKAALLTQAKALLVPIQWEEPFGLVMIEAMACGTPVIALRRGAAPEIVENKKTGFVVDTVDEMVEAVKKIDTINRHACRKRVEKFFTRQHMGEQYSNMYEKIVRKRKSHT